MDKFYRKVHWIKKGTFSRRVFSILMALAMIISLLPMNAMEVKAAEGTQPSVTAYATKDQLMTAFTPNSFGTATTVGKLVFGKNSSGAPQEWYILGKDTGVSGDNTIIFAASPIATNREFNSDTSDKTYDSTTVYANHYGASDLRGALQNMATYTSYFTSAEQGLMNATTVTTNDTKNGGTYTTTDKLYALAADSCGFMYTTIKAGTNNQTVLAMNSYCKSGDEFWLRLPYVNNGNTALVACPRSYVDSLNVTLGRAVQPASNLNLSSVLFASSAQAASSDTAVPGTIASGKAMTLRLDGSSKNIGTITYDTATGDIVAAKGSTTGTVALVVQGNDGTDDWYYSKQITGTETVNVSGIKTALGSSADINLSACKIWLETTDGDGMIYAVNATEGIIPVTYTITASSDSNGSISPSGSVEVTEGEDQTFTITPNDGYEIGTLKVDGKAVTASTSYTFSNVTAGHTIDVTFKAKSVTPTPEPDPTPTPTPEPDPTPTPDPEPEPTPTPEPGPEEHTHTIVTDAAVAATCTETGLTAGSHCSVCGEVIVAQKEVSALGHDWSGEWKIVKEATATEAGKMETTCTRDGCGTKKYKEIPATGTPADPYEGKLDKDAEVAPDAPIEEATLDNTKKELLEAPAIFTTVEKAAIESGAEARVWIEISKTDESSIPSEDKTKISETAKSIMGEDSSITYFDANLFKKVGDGFTTPLHEPGIDVEVTIKVPTSLVNTDNKFEREYKIIRLHTDVTTGENSVDILDGTFDKTTGELTFKTDKFSTYAIAYTDKKLVTGVTLTSGTGTTTLTQAGQSVQLTATVTPTDATDKSVTWTSSNTNVATVDATGKVTAVANGTCVITATTIDGGKTATVTITVNIPSTGKDDGATGSTANATPTDTENKTTSPKTGDDTPIGWLFALVLVSASGMIVVGKKRKYI